MRAVLVALIALILAPGCTPSALQHESVSLAGASSDLRYREVIENLAMIAANPWTLPAYSSVYSGAMDVTDSAGFGEGTTWVHSISGPSGFSSQTLDIPMSRSVKGALTLDPMIVPEKIRALRAACQWAVFDGNVLSQEDGQLLKRFELGLPAGNYFGVEPELRDISQGIPWLGKGCSHDVPKNACYCAHCGSAFVWVCPEGMDGFSRFVLVCQKIARFDTSTLWQPRPGTKTVKWGGQDLNNPRIQMVTAYVDEYGDLALGANTPALPPKTRVDNVGSQSDLKAVINAVTKGP
jgi:hypothetical protein